MIAVAFSVLVALGSEAAPVCSSPAELDVQFANLLLEVRPGLTFDALSRLLGGPSHGRLYPKSDGTREAMFEPRVREGTREVGAGLRCIFTPDDLLNSCEVDVGPFHVQFVERDRVAQLQKGQGVGEVFQTLCTPGRIQLLSSGDWEALYFFREGGSYGAQAVTIAFNPDGRLTMVETGH